MMIDIPAHGHLILKRDFHCVFTCPLVTEQHAFDPVISEKAMDVLAKRNNYDKYKRSAHIFISNINIYSFNKKSRKKLN